METFSALLAICAGNSPVPVNSPHKGQWRGTLMFTLICARINGRVNNREAGDLRRYHTHYNVIVMTFTRKAFPCHHITILQIYLQHTLPTGRVWVHVPASKVMRFGPVYPIWYFEWRIVPSCYSPVNKIVEIECMHTYMPSNIKTKTKSRVTWIHVQRKHLYLDTRLP